MTRGRIDELIEKATDEELSPTERNELDEFLDADPEARKLATRMAELDELLNSAAKVSPPRDLRDRIMRELPMQARAETLELRKTRPFLSPRWFIWHAVSAAFGALLAISFYESQAPISSSVDISELVGTIAPDATGSKRVLLDRMTIDSNGVSSRAVLEQRNGLLVLDVSIDAARPITITVDLAGAGLEFEALAQRPGSLDSIVLDKDTLTVAGTGQRRFSILLHSSTSSRPAGNAGLRLDFSSQGKLLGQGSLDLNMQTATPVE